MISLKTTQNITRCQFSFNRSSHWLTKIHARTFVSKQLRNTYTQETIETRDNIDHLRFVSLLVFENPIERDQITVYIIYSVWIYDQLHARAIKIATTSTWTSADYLRSLPFLISASRTLIHIVRRFKMDKNNADTTRNLCRWNVDTSNANFHRKLTEIRPRKGTATDCQNTIVTTVTFLWSSFSSVQFYFCSFYPFPSHTPSLFLARCLYKPSLPPSEPTLASKWQHDSAYRLCLAMASTDF